MRPMITIGTHTKFLSNRALNDLSSNMLRALANQDLFVCGRRPGRRHRQVQLVEGRQLEIMIHQGIEWVLSATSERWSVIPKSSSSRTMSTTRVVRRATMIQGGPWRGKRWEFEVARR